MFKFIQPTGILKNYIKYYSIIEDACSFEYMPKVRIFPNGNVVMVFHYGSPSKFQKKNSEEYIEPRLVICGQQTSYYDLSVSGKTGMILIAFKPHGVRPFFNFPVNELLNENISMHDLIKNEARELEDKLLNSENNEQRIENIENFLMERLSLNKDFNRVEHAIKIIENYKGQVKAHSLANEVCLGIKQFERVFFQNVGLKPKKYASIVRFQNIIQHQKKHNNINLYQLAFDNGYYDQAHFIHDFKNLTGLSPGAFFKAKE